MSLSPSPEAVILRTEHLSRVAEGKLLVQDASFDVLRGDVLAIAGPSGSGKTSLLRLLNRLDEPTSGTVYVEGIDYRQIPPRDLRCKLGMVTQRPFLFPGTVEANIQFGPRQRGEVLPPPDIENLLARVGLPGYQERNVSNLSGGEAQRVSLARTLANKPTILLLDEPTSALDEAAKRGIEVLIQEIVAEQNLTCVIVTHDISQALRLAQRAVVMEQGHIIRSGAIPEVLHA
jgi:putative ABC transport system ATP-binding protein